MAEGPVNFGKPLAILVILGCAGAGYWAYKNWPSHYEGQGWGIDWPNKWESSEANDPARPGKINASGPLKLEEHGSGVGWATVNYHGALNFQPFVEEKLGYPLEKVETGFDIGNKTAMTFEYEEQDRVFRFQGVAVQRGDAVVIAAIGCRKGVFEDNKQQFLKVVKSLRCTR
jgi:hypothetical protein